MKYPTGTKKSSSHPMKETNYANRGMDFEKEINDTNYDYRAIGRAYIYKKPTPIKISKVDYPKKGKAIIKEAFFESPSTTDYNGIYRGKYIDFEAKETRSKTSFPYSNIHPHQIEHMKDVTKAGGICFLLIRFCTLNETYLLRATDFFYHLEQKKTKSIPISFIREYGFAIKEKYKPRVDYLEIVDHIPWEVNNDKRNEE